MSQLPAFVLVGLLVAAVILLGVTAWLVRGLRGVPGVAGRVTVAGLLGVVALCVSLFVAGMRHYGGSPNLPDVAYNCGPWWQEAGLPADRPAQVGDLSTTCRHDAIAAIGPAVGWSALIGFGVAVVVAGGWLAVARLRRQRRPRPVRQAVTYVDNS